MHRWIKVVKHTGHQNHYLLQQQFKRSTQGSPQSLVILIWYAPEPVLTLIRTLTNPIRSVMLLIFKISISDSHIGIWSNHGSKSVSVNRRQSIHLLQFFKCHTGVCWFISKASFDVNCLWSYTYALKAGRCFCIRCHRVVSIGAIMSICKIRCIGAVEASKF